MPSGAAQRLRETCLAELSAEVERDEADGVASVPPLLPPGWSMRHEAGSSFFIMERTVTERAGAAADMRYRGMSAATDLAGDPFADPSLRGVPADALRRMRPQAAREAEMRREARTPMHVAIRCRFNSLDLSAFDATTDVCEWVPFDVRVVKPGCGVALMLYLVSANSTLRVRGTQLLRFRNDDVGAAAAAAAGGLDAHELLGWSMAAEHNRRLRYNGPLVADLAKPMQYEMSEYVTRTLGIDATVVEFVCQMLYCAEHDEYLRWLVGLSKAGEMKTT